MREIEGDLWDYYGRENTIVLITTNGMIRNNVTAVMGRGCANEASRKFPRISGELGVKIKRWGNIIHFLDKGRILSFPVKRNFWEDADLDLIRESARRLKWMADELPKKTFVLPRPGCGNGGLEWDKVKPLLSQLPDNVLVIHRPGE